VSVALHRGLSSEVRFRLQLAGFRIEEIDAQRALLGQDLVKGGILTEVREFLDEIVADVLILENRLKITREWEERNPGKEPFPPTFAETVLDQLRNINADNPMETVAMLIELAEAELLFG
jgi:hypothetical protein